MSVPTVKLNSGYEMPIVGLGTWKSKPGEVTQAVKHALSVGYRHIDCAWLYQNEKEVGEGIRQSLNEGVVKREDIFITSKLWNTFHRKDDVKPALKETLSNLGLEYLDLYLMHWPTAWKRDAGHWPTDEQGKILYSDDGYMDAWHAMEECVQEGLVRSIGLSNFNSKQIEDIWEHSSVRPTVNQCECHPYLTQQPLIDFCKNKGIVFTAYSPIGCGDHPNRQNDASFPSLLTDPVLVKIAEKNNRSPAQVALRFNTQRNVVVIPKSVTPSRIEQNMKLFDFELSSEDTEAILKMDRNWRGIPFAALNTHKDYPFNISF